MYVKGEKGHNEFKLYCNAEQSAVTKVSVKLPLAVVTAFAKHKQQNGESFVHKFILFFQFKVISLFN